MNGRDITVARRPLVAALILTALTGLGVAQDRQAPWPREPETPNAPRPEPAPVAWLGLIGEYATGGAEPSRLIVLERDGRLMAMADEAPAAPIETGAFARGNDMRGARVTWDGETYTRVPLGPEPGTAQLRIRPLRPVAQLVEEAKQAEPPAEKGDFLPPDLVELTTLDPSIRLDIRYATTNNFLGSVFYSQPRAFLQRPAAEALVRVNRTLGLLGYGLLVHDGYRPWYVTKAFWDATPEDTKWLVANPASGSRHNRGAAVDLTLYDRKTGDVIEMPSTYDESTHRAYAFYPGGTTLERWHRALLRRSMEVEGFTVNPEEWWHFDFNDWQRYRIGNVPFEQIQGGQFQIED
ncbi:MAG: M15 family metallopeptidase [Vicinamibacterales bacterium]